MAHFKIKDLGEVEHCIGLKITRDRSAGKIWIDHSTYVEGILNLFNVRECNLVTTSLDINQKLSKDMSPKTEEERAEMVKIPYQEAVGCLMFACQERRPDIAHSVGVVIRFNNNTGKAHWITRK